MHNQVINLNNQEKELYVSYFESDILSISEFNPDENKGIKVT